jgi:response regulator NasT
MCDCAYPFFGQSRLPRPLTFARAHIRYHPAMQRLRIIAADDDPEIRSYYSKMLVSLGHEAVGIVSTGAQLVEQCRLLDPDLIITDIKMPDMEGVEAAHKIYQEKPRPVILVSGMYDPKAFERAMADQIVGYLIKPVTREGLREQIEMVMQRYAEFAILCEQSTQFRQALRDRKIVERAKALLMRSAQMQEGAAFGRLQEIARQHNQKIATAAQVIVAATAT